jgi:hypothetical protein
VIHDVLLKESLRLEALLMRTLSLPPNSLEFILWYVAHLFFEFGYVSAVFLQGMPIGSE